MSKDRPVNYQVFGNYYVTRNHKERTWTIYDKNWRRLSTVDDGELTSELRELEEESTGTED